MLTPHHTPHILLLAIVAFFTGGGSLLLAQAPNQPAAKNFAISATDADGLRAQLKTLGDRFQTARLQGNAKADIAILLRAVQTALDHSEWYDAKDVAAARELLAECQTRLSGANERQTPWTRKAGLTVLGYQSRIDATVQPYGLLIPDEVVRDPAKAARLDIWLLGRDDKRTEIRFIAERLKKQPEFNPAGALVLVPYGRYCNATKFAGEVDVYEALDDVRRRFAIDPARISVRGFSMGGASTWHLGAHDAGRWAAVAPGAGFAETAQYTRVLASGATPPPWYEQTLWRWYDATQYAGNLFNTGVVAYSGENDKQRQAATIMESAMAAEGLKLTHLIGPGVEHKYEPKTKLEVARQVDAIVAKGSDPFPASVKLTTYTLRYGQMKWVQLLGLDQHWERADITAERIDPGTIRVTTRNVSAFAVNLPENNAATDLKRITIDGTAVSPGAVGWSREVGWQFSKHNGTWTAGPLVTSLRKSPGLTGPIDDAFMSGFVFVPPSGTSASREVDAWVTTEFQRARSVWRSVFRGDARVIPATDPAALPADANWVLWGDTKSNPIIAKLLGKTPAIWQPDAIRLGGKSFPGNSQVLLMIYPNPLHPGRYIVLNSGFTFREAALKTNAQQTPKLPDWAVVDVRTPPSPTAPGAVVDAGFFSETWTVTESQPGKAVAK
jgi:hypothetical protein